MYPTNTYGYFDFLEVDTLSVDVGCDVGAADPYLTKALAPLNSSSVDMGMWDLLPWAFAATLSSSHWKDAQYIPWAECFNNNMLMMSQTIVTLTVTLQAITAKVY